MELGNVRREEEIIMEPYIEMLINGGAWIAYEIHEFHYHDCGSVLDMKQKTAGCRLVKGRSNCGRLPTMWQM